MNASREPTAGRERDEAVSSPHAIPGGSLTVAVLAGGRSSRFGGDKSLAVLRGRTLLQMALDTAAAMTEHRLLSLGCLNPDFGIHCASDEPPLPPGVVPVHDGVSSAGPLAGLLACLEACTTPWLILLPVDMPGITPEVLGILTLHGDAGGACFRWKERIFPLPLLIASPSLPIVRKSLAEGRRSVHSLLDLLEIRTIDIDLFPDLGDPEVVLANINTPEDFHRAGRSGT